MEKTGLIKYDAMVLAIAEASAVDEVLDIKDKAAALKLYAKQVKNKTTHVQFAELEMRAERRLGQMMAEQKAAGQMNKGGQPAQTKNKPNPTGLQKNPVEIEPNPTGVKKTPVEIEQFPPTLADVGIDKNLANRARKLAAVGEAEFERVMSEHRDEQKAVTKRTFQKLEDAAPEPENSRLIAAWVAASSDERVEFMDFAGLTHRENHLSDGKVDAGVWAEFVAHREAIRKPLRKQSAQKNYAILAAMSFDEQRACVDQTIANSWQGLFPPKGNKKKSAGDEMREAAARLIDG